MTKPDSRRRMLLPLLTALLLLFLLLISAEAAADGCRRALAVCARMLVPALFPFFVLSSLLNALGLPGLLGRALAPAAMRLYGVSGAGASALLMGLCGGYPTGAAYIAELEKNGAVTCREAERLLAFCNNSGPAFLIGAVGCGVFHSVKAGLLLYAAHVAAALLTGLFFRVRSFPEEIPPVFLDGFVAFFSVLLSAAESLGLLDLPLRALTGLGAPPAVVRPMLAGLLELGSGVAAMEGMALSPASLALAAFLTGWGGLSVYFQTRALLAEGKAKGALHLAGHLLSASIGAAAAFLLGALFL